MKILFLLLLGLFFPLLGFAHGTNYLEYNPDRTSSLKDADVATPSQVFFAQSDFFNGFDVWLANPGSSGTATFSLVNDGGIVLVSKTVTIPNIVLTTNGTRFHVDFNSQLPVLADDKYSIRVVSSMPELRLYYSDRVQVLSHNAPFASEYLTGVAKLGAEEQVFSFKYALYETNETSAPIISNIAWTVISGGQMRIDFNSNEAVDYRIEYGPAGQGYSQSTDFLNGYDFCTYGISLCSITIPVNSATNYEYRLTAKDSWGNQSQMTGTFTSGQGQAPSVTPTPPDQLPAISNLRVADVTNNSVALAWTTDEIANSELIISFSSDYITIDTANDPTFELEHYLESSPVLGSGGTYIATVTSTDIDNNFVRASLSFTTLSGPTPTPTPSPTATPPPPTSSPVISESPAPMSSTPPLQQSQTPLPTNIIITSNSSGDGTSTVTVQWNPPTAGEPSDGYRVDVFDNEGKLVKTIFAPSGSNSAEIPELTDGEEYKVIVYANNEGVFQKVDKPVTLKAGDDTFLNRLLSMWPFLLIPVALLGVFLWLRKRKPSQAFPQVVS